MDDRLSYPDTRRELVRASVGGIELEDPYRWLEADTDEAIAWGDAQSAIARGYIRSWEHFDAVREQLSQTGFLFMSQSWPGPARCGEQWVHVVDRRNKLPQLMIAPEPFGAGRVIFDPDELSSSEPRKLNGFLPSPDGRHVAVCLADQRIGHDHSGLGPVRVTVWRIIDVATQTARPLGGHFAAWAPDGSFFLIAPHGDSVEVFRQLADRPDESVLELAGAAGLIQVSADGRYTAILDWAAENMSGTAGARITHIRDAHGWRSFDPDVHGRCQGAFVGDAYVAIVTDGSPRGRVVSIPVDKAADRDAWTELVAEGERNARFLSVVADRVVVGMTTDAGFELELFHTDGSPDGAVPLPPGQIPNAFTLVDGHNAIRPCPGGFYFAYNEAFVELPAFYRFDVTTRALTKTPAPVAGLGPLAVTVVDDYYSAADGVRIPIRVIHRPGLDLSVARPLLLHGYGNLDLCFYEPPAWFTPFLDAGGVVAWVTLRGGGDFGDEWRHAGREKNKGQCSLDFCGAAEHLIDKGIAERDRVAAFGFSGGAFLTGITLARLGRQVRPDLFRAVAGVGGCYDMFTYGGPAGEFVDEWGDPRDPEMAQILTEWSAYQNVQDGVHYPSTLIACTDGDIGWAGQARKMTAAVQHASASDAPILHRRFDIHWHGEVGAISGENGPDSGEVAAEIAAFVMRELGMEPVSGA